MGERVYTLDLIVSDTVTLYTRLRFYGPNSSISQWSGLDYRKRGTRAMGTIFPLYKTRRVYCGCPESCLDELEKFEAFIDLEVAHGLIFLRAYSTTNGIELKPAVDRYPPRTEPKRETTRAPRPISVIQRIIEPLSTPNLQAKIEPRSVSAPAIQRIIEPLSTPNLQAKIEPRSVSAPVPVPKIEINQETLDSTDPTNLETAQQRRIRRRTVYRKRHSAGPTV